MGTLPRGSGYLDKVFPVAGRPHTLREEKPHKGTDWDTEGHRGAHFSCSSLSQATQLLEALIIPCPSLDLTLVLQRKRARGLWAGGCVPGMRRKEGASLAEPYPDHGDCPGQTSYVTEGDPDTYTHRARSDTRGMHGLTPRLQDNQSDDDSQQKPTVHSPQSLCPLGDRFSLGTEARSSWDIFRCR